MKFYRNIFKENGKYRILKKNVDYGIYENLEDALHDRDILEMVDWDWDEFCSIDPMPNDYIGMELPPFQKNEYINVETNRHGNKPKYCIVKSIDGKRKRFGRYDSFEEAVRVRDLLIEHDWCKISELKDMNLL